MHEVVVPIVTAVGGAVAGGATAWTAIRRSGSDVARVQVEAAKVTVEGVYEPIVQRLRVEFDELREDCERDKALMSAQVADMRASLERERAARVELDERLTKLIEDEVVRQLVAQHIAGQGPQEQPHG